MTVTERDRQAFIWFREGQIRAIATDPERVFDYNAIASRAHAASAEAFREAAKRRRRRRSLREALSQHTTFDGARYDEAIEAAVREELVLLFGWTNASFVFEEDQPDDALFDADQIAADLTIDPQSIAMEAARRVDEWEAIGHHIQSERDIFLPVAALPEDSSPAINRLLCLLDGTRDLRQIIGELPQGRFHVLRMVADLAERGLVVRATPEQLRDLSREAEEEGEIHLAAGHLESALEMAPGDADARRALVRLYERSGRRNEAAREYKRLAKSHERKGDLDAARSFFEHAIELVPYDVESLERVVAIHEQCGERDDFMRAGMRLGEAFTSQRLHDEALELYRRLLEQDPESIILRELVAACYVKLHEPKRAAHELMQLARNATGREDFERALHYYRSVLAVDRNCAEAKERIDEIDHGRKRRTRRVRRRRVLAVVGAIVLGLAAWQATREWEARGAMHTASRAALSSMTQNDPDRALVDAIESHADIVERYPYTSGAREAEETVQALLTDALARMRQLAVEDPARVGPFLASIGRIQLPESVRSFWGRARDDFLRTFDVSVGQG